VHATDVNEETLALARARPWPRDNVTFERRDAYTKSAAPPRCDAGFAAGWLSHVDLARMGEFLDAFHSHLVPGAMVMMFDERDHRNRPLPASRTDAAGNRYEARTLASGEGFESSRTSSTRPHCATRSDGARATWSSRSCAASGWRPGR